MLILPGHDNRVRGLAYAPDGRSLASCGTERTVRLWDLATGDERRVFRGHRRPVLGVVFGLDGRTLISAGGEPSVRAWDAIAGGPLRVFDPTAGSGVDLLQLLIGGAPPIPTPGARLLAAEAAGWRLSRARPRWVSELIDYAEFEKAIEGSILAMGFPHEARAGFVSVRVGSEERRYLIPETLNGTRCGAYVSGCGFSLDHSTEQVAAFSPDDRTLALTAGHFVQLWDLDRRRLITLEGHRNPVRSLAFAPDGRTLATGGHDGTVRLWDTVRGHERACFDWEIGMIDSVAFAPDGMTLAAGGRRGIVVWDVDEDTWR